MWIAPDITTIKTRITGAELDALKGAARASGVSPDDTIEKAISRVVRQIRGYVGTRHKLGEEGTIPDELESAFGALWLVEFITRIPNSGKLLDDRRTKAAEDALTQLRDVAAGRFAIVAPIEPAPAVQQAAGPAISLVSAGVRVNKTTDTSGLF